ncbi:hypothetical protein, partial [Streptococcus suis]
TAFSDMSYLFDNQDKFNDLIRKIFKKKQRAIELLEIANEQMDRFQKTIEKTTYAALDCITTIDKNKIEPRISEIDVLSTTVLGDKQLK